MSENPANKEDGKLIDLGKSFSNPILKLSSPIVEKLFDVDNFNDFYTRTCRMPQELNFFDRALHVTSIDYVISTEDRERIPAEGPIIIVANHPHGIADGLILGSLLLSVRGDVKFIVNYLLGAMKELDPYFIQVNPFGGNNATKTNASPIKEVFKYIKQGGCIGTFPSGTVSHLFLSKRRVTDPVWNENIAAIARKTRATVVPIFIGGRNSNLFQAAGLIHPKLRTALLLREVVASAGQTIELRVGQPIPPARLDKFATNAEVIDYLRLKTYILGNRTEPEKRLHFIRMPSLTRQKKLIDPLAQPIPPEALEAEIKTLPKDALLVSHGDMQVYLTDYASIPTIIQEIGRLREKTFRAVGEGTGKSLDIDEYDPHYLHLFMWNPKAREIVGGYRLGRTDKILEEFGPKGIYTSSLFHFKDQLLERISPALEMGRSYIREEYQRKPNALPLLWRGIGEYVSRNQQYRVLFGPVSISSDYKAFSRDLMVQYLRNNTLDVNLHGYVKARRPPRSGNKMQQVDKKSLNASVRDIEDISELISDIETDRKGVPVLIRHYLKLNATILSFNVDKDFCNVIDGLIMVDLMRTDLKILRRFMGEDAVEQFTARHASAPQISEAPVPAGR